MLLLCLVSWGILLFEHVFIPKLAPESQELQLKLAGSFVFIWAVNRKNTNQFV